MATPRQIADAQRENDRVARLAGQSGDGSCGGGPIGKSAHERAGGKPMQAGRARSAVEYDMRQNPGKRR